MQDVNHESRSGGIPRPLKCPDDYKTCGLCIARHENGYRALLMRDRTGHFRAAERPAHGALLQ